MVKEIIFILILIVVILIAVASSGPSPIIRSEPMEATTVPATKKKNVQVRFSPEKKERTYSVKTGKIISDNIVVVEDIELNE